MTWNVFRVTDGIALQSRSVTWAAVRHPLVQNAFIVSIVWITTIKSNISSLVVRYTWAIRCRLDHGTCRDNSLRHGKSCRKWWWKAAAFRPTEPSFYHMTAHKTTPLWQVWLATPFRDTRELPHSQNASAKNRTATSILAPFPSAYLSNLTNHEEAHTRAASLHRKHQNCRTHILKLKLTRVSFTNNFDCA